MFSRLTSMYQTKIPRQVLERLGLKAGDVVKYEIADGCVILSKATALEVRQLGQVKRPPRERHEPEDASA